MVPDYAMIGEISLYSMDLLMQEGKKVLISE